MFAMIVALPRLGSRPCESSDKLQRDRRESCGCHGKRRSSAREGRNPRQACPRTRRCGTHQTTAFRRISSRCGLGRDARMDLNWIELGVLAITLEHFRGTGDICNARHENMPELASARSCATAASAIATSFLVGSNSMTGLNWISLKYPCSWACRREKVKIRFPPIGSSSFRNGVAVNWIILFFRTVLKRFPGWGRNVMRFVDKKTWAQLCHRCITSGRHWLASGMVVTMTLHLRKKESTSRHRSVAGSKCPPRDKGLFRNDSKRGVLRQAEGKGTSPLSGYVVRRSERRPGGVDTVRQRESTAWSRSSQLLWEAQQSQGLHSPSSALEQRKWRQSVAGGAHRCCAPYSPLCSGIHRSRTRGNQRPAFVVSDVRQGR